MMPHGSFALFGQWNWWLPGPLAKILPARPAAIPRTPPAGPSTRDQGARWHAGAGDRRERPTEWRAGVSTSERQGRTRVRPLAGLRQAPPPPGPYGALVRPIAAATCDLDRPLALGATMFPLPLHLGHECVAEVLAVGDQVTGVQTGQRVVVPFQISCGACGPCAAGLTGSCSAVPPISMYGFGLGGGHWGGAFSDQLAVPYADAMLVPLPAGEIG